jgi:hypothetical protein
MSSFWNKPKSLYDLAGELADRISNEPDYNGSAQLLYKGGGGAGLNQNPSNPQTNPLHVNAFFDSQHDRISQLAKEMNVQPNFLLGLSAGESNWGRPQGQNNLFGLNDVRTGRPANYASPDDSINAFRNSQWYSRLQDKNNADDFVNELISTQNGKYKYNSIRGDYNDWVKSMIGTVDRRLPIWEQSP